ncbi:hypothetical protein GOODEAATRI_027356 [Goodea atripinnis]|uniref:Uncharacterized protein n=1 Tax=Goodea atripinnis TaxID=208336 RepID=A0ABV0NNL4_9TELE
MQPTHERACWVHLMNRGEGYNSSRTIWPRRWSRLMLHVPIMGTRAGSGPTNVTHVSLSFPILLLWTRTQASVHYNMIIASCCQ